MILLSAIIIGFLAGWGWALWHKKPYRAPAPQFVWLVLVGFTPQLVIAYLPATHRLLPDWLAALSLLASLVLFLVFVWLNRRLPGMLILLVGLVLNLVVIVANRGWMPISPQTASQLINGDAIKTVGLGNRFGQKDVLLTPEATVFGFLADRFLLPRWFPYQVAFSLGDIFIAIGAFWLLARPSTDANIQME